MRRKIRKYYPSCITRHNTRWSYALKCSLKCQNIRENVEVFVGREKKNIKHDSGRNDELAAGHKGNACVNVDGYCKTLYVQYSIVYYLLYLCYVRELPDIGLALNNCS